MNTWGKVSRWLMAACVLVLGLCLALVAVQLWPAPPETVVLKGVSDAARPMPGQGVQEGYIAKGIAPASTAQGNRVHINTATKEELMTLPGIGPHLAGQIIKARDNHPFYFPEDLMTVPGIGEKRLSQLRDLIQIP